MTTAVAVYDGLNVPYWKRRGPNEIASFNTDFGRVVFAEVTDMGMVHRFFIITRPGETKPCASTYSVLAPDVQKEEFPTGFTHNGRWIVFSPEKRKAYTLPVHHLYDDYRHLRGKRVPCFMLTATRSA